LRQAVYYFTANKLLEGPDDLTRWERLAKDAGLGDNLNESHPYFPRCVVIDDLPKDYGLGRNPLRRPQPKLLPTPAINEAGAPTTYDVTVNAQKVFNWLIDNRDRVSTIWVLSCEASSAKAWRNFIRDCVCGEKREQDENRGEEDAGERAERVLDIDLGDPPHGRAVRRGP
jgi:hypothetical protein